VQVDAVEYAVDLANADDDDPIRRRRAPDFVPGTNALQTENRMLQHRMRSRSHRRQSHSLLSFHSMGVSAHSVNSELTQTHASTPGPPRKSRSKGPVRPSMMRMPTWRTSAPKLDSRHAA